MDNLWAPWRAEYILRSEKVGCFLCQEPKENKDETNFILYRGQSNFIILNSYPYNPGHLLIAPYRHLGNPEAMTDEEAKEHFALLKLCHRLLIEVAKPAGFNIGMNLGKVSGAGLDDHLHTHVVPRWQGDTNFMAVTSNTRVLSEGLADTYKKLKDGLAAFL
jgi:ATP adenylyltransferase